jgi:tetratricopeptide (TPR) repeat protein
MIAVHLYVGRPQAAHQLDRKLRRIDPLDGGALWMLPAAHFFDAKFDLALIEFRKIHEMAPENPNWLAWYALALAYNDQIDHAEGLIEPSAEAHASNVHTKLVLMQIRGLQGNKQGVLSELQGPFLEWTRERAWATRVAAAFALLDEREEALDWMEHAVDHGFINYPWLSEGDPWLDNIRGEKRFKDLMVRVRHEWEAFEI